MREELIIRGESVDLSKETGITLNYRSNLFSDISKIDASYSYTIQLPKTTRNRLILDNPGAPAYDSSFRYKRFPAKYIRNGITILDDAYCMLTGCGKTYTVALYWGGVSKYKEWVDGEAKLTDLEIIPATTVWGEGVVASFPPQVRDIYFDYETGIGSASTIPEGAKPFANLLPSVTAANLLNSIESAMGVTFSYPAWFATAIQRLAIPILQHKGTATGYMEAPITGLGDGNQFSTTKGLWFEAPSSGLYSTEQDDIPYFGTEGTLLSLSNAGVVYFHYVGSVQIQLTSTYSYPIAEQALLDEVKFSVVVQDAEGAALRIVNYTCTSSVIYEAYGSSVYEFTPRGYTEPLYVEEGQQVGIVFDFSSLNQFEWQYRVYSYDGHVVIRPFLEDGADIVPGDTLDLALNLPDMKQTDFLKALCGLFGLFIMPRKDEVDAFDFVNISDIIARKIGAVDWSSKLVRENDEEPSTMSFKVGEYAQRNNFKYQEDTAPQGYGDGVLKVENVTLNEEEDAVELEFAASQGSLIPIFRYSEDMTSVETETLKPRIMQIVESTTGTCMLSFNELRFDYVLGKYYKELRRLLNSAVVLKLKFRLDERDLAELDFMKPIYLQQFGRYYGLQTLQTSSTMMCEAELVQLPTFEELPSNVRSDKLGESGENSKLGIIKLGYYIDE